MGKKRPARAERRKTLPELPLIREMEGSSRLPGLRLNEYIGADGPTVFAHACKMGLEGIVSKGKTSTYRSGRSPDWLKARAEEDWSKERWR